MRKNAMVRVRQVLQQQREVDRHVAHKVVARPARLVQLRQHCRATYVQHLQFCETTVRGLAACCARGNAFTGSISMIQATLRPLVQCCLR